MGASLVSIVYTLAASLAGYFVAPKDDEYGLIRIVAMWIVSAAIAFMIDNNLAILFLVGIVGAFLAGRSPVLRVCFYLGVFAALPKGVKELIPFPGINYLIEIDYGKILTIFVLGPVFFKFASKPGPRHLRIVDQFLLVFAVLSGVMSIRDLPITSVMRSTVDQIFLVYIPYIAITRALVTQEDVDKALKALAVCCVILMGVGLISILVHWNYYANLFDKMNSKVYSDTRNGFLRIYGPLVPTLLGLFMGMGFVGAMWLWMRKRLPMLFMLGLAGAYGLVCFATGSRGGMMCAMLAVASMLVFVMFGQGVRRLYLIAMAAGVVSVFALVGQGSSLLDDEYGTLNYRAELIRTSIPQIASRPLFGASDFLEKPQFEELRQGEGIIDLVNTYLQLALFYGLVGLGLYLGAHFAAMSSALKQLSRLPQRAPPDTMEGQQRRTVACLIAMHVAYLAMLATVSAVSYGWHIGYALLALVVAQSRVLALPRVAPAEAPPAILEEDGEAGDAAQAPSKPLPYGARFVRRIQS